jgi:hypothetical protein
MPPSLSVKARDSGSTRRSRLRFTTPKTFCLALTPPAAHRDGSFGALPSGRLRRRGSHSRIQLVVFLFLSFSLSCIPSTATWSHRLFNNMSRGTCVACPTLDIGNVTFRLLSPLHLTQGRTFPPFGDFEAMRRPEIHGGLGRRPSIHSFRTLTKADAS